jgi:hypothetical protein
MAEFREQCLGCGGVRTAEHICPRADRPQNPVYAELVDRYEEDQ